MHMDLAIDTAPKDVTGSCRTCKKQFEEGDLRVCMNPAFDLREINRLSSKTPVPKADNITRTFVHLDCLDFYAIKAFQCMFHETIGKLEEDDTRTVESTIKNWQNEHTKMRKLEKQLTRVEYEDGDVTDATASNKRKAKTSPDKEKKIKKKKLMAKKQYAASQEEPSFDENDEDVDEEEDPFVGELSRDIWANVFVYLPPKDFANLSLTSRAFSDLCSTPTVWRRLCYEQVSPDFSTIRKEFFEGDNNFKELYQNTYKKVCNDCRTFCGETVYKIHQFYLTDTVLCDDCRAKPIYKVISKTDAKKQYKLADSDFALMRCLKASNPFHRSSPMYRFLEAQIQHLVRTKNIQMFRSQLRDQCKVDKSNPVLVAVAYDRIDDWIDEQLASGSLVDSLDNYNMIRKNYSTLSWECYDYVDQKLKN